MFVKLSFFSNQKGSFTNNDTQSHAIQILLSVIFMQKGPNFGPFYVDWGRK